MKKMLVLLVLLLAVGSYSQAQIKIKVPQVKTGDKDKNKDKEKDKDKDKEKPREDKVENKAGNNTAGNSTSASGGGTTYRAGDIVEVLYSDGIWYEAEVREAGGSGRYQIQYTVDKAYAWVYPDKMRATNKPNKLDEEKKRLASFKQYNVGDIVTWDGGYKDLSASEITKIESPGVYMTRVGVRLTADKIKGTWTPVFKVGDKVVVPDRQYGHYNASTVTKVAEGQYYLDNSNTSTDPSWCWPMWDYQGFYDLFYSRMDSDNMVLFRNMQALDRGENTSASTVSPEKIKTYLAATDAVEKELKAKYATTPHIDNCKECPEDIMHTLANRRKLFADHYFESPQAAAERYYSMAAAKVESLKEGKNLGEPADEWLASKNPDAALEKHYADLYESELKKLEENYKLVNMPVPPVNKAELFAKVKAQRAAYETALLAKDWFATYTDKFTRADASLDGLVRSYIAKTDSKATIIKMGFSDGDWEKYESTTYWVAGRAKYAMVWVSNPEYNFKYVYAIKISQEYFGNGKYGESSAQMSYWFFYGK